VDTTVKTQQMITRYSTSHVLLQSEINRDIKDANEKGFRCVNFVITIGDGYLAWLLFEKQ